MARRAGGHRHLFDHKAPGGDSNLAPVSLFLSKDDLA